MIQFNLLPDIKQQYLKAQRQKHLVMFVSTVAIIAAVAIFVVLLLVVQVWQKKSISDLNRDITSNKGQLSSTQDLNKILTVQNQLNTIGPLHDKKPVASRLFDDLTKVTPADVTISNMSIDFAKDTISLSGSAASLEPVNTYVDTLKFTTYQRSTDTTSSASRTAFSKVVLLNFGKTTQATSYTIAASFDPAIFSSASDVTLTVPQKTTTRSVINQPTDLFKQAGS